jgi:hypothetical protein
MASAQDSWIIDVGGIVSSVESAASLVAGTVSNAVSTRRRSGGAHTKGAQS